MSKSAEETPLFLQETMDQARALEKQLIDIAWFMRGGIPLDQANNLTTNQRKYALQLIEQNIDRTNKTGVMMH